MRIARLELHGFKSFADRTVFHFGPGISCVVGPNGCGKSNVVDALKWVIGEMSAKSLRGDDMLDVIFAGSSERKPVGYAEVSLTFSADGTDPFPGEYARFSEMQLTRRLYRDSTSEYLLNQTRCRRKDIVDLIMDSGVGNHLYSFIEQGRIDKIVSASPEERRSLVDEAAGNTRYKQRRHEAQQKLEATATQLDRAADVVDEMARRLATLEKAVIKAARFRRARAIVRQHEIALSLARLSELRRDADGIQARLAEVSSGAVFEEERADLLTEDLGLREGELEIASTSVANAREVVVEIDADRRAADAVLGLHSKRVEEVETQVKAARDEIDLAQSRGEQAEQRAAEATSWLEELEVAILEGVELAETAAITLRAAEVEQTAARDALAEVELAAERASSELREAQTRQEGLLTRDRELAVAVERATGRSQGTADELIVTTKRIEVAEGAIIGAREEIELIEAERELAASELDDVIRREVHARDAVARAEQDLDEAQRAWTIAVQAVEAEGGRIEEVVSREVAVALRQEDEAFGQRAREASRRLAEGEDAARRANAEQTSAGQARVEAVRATAEADHERWRQQAVAAFDAQDQQRQAAVDEAARSGADEVALIEATWRAEYEESVANARARREEAERAVEAARTQLRDVEAKIARAERSLRELEGQLAAVEAEQRAALSRDAGAAAVVKAVPEARRLVDRVDPSELERPEVARALGDRLLMPVLESADAVLRAAVAARKAGTARVLLVGGPVTVGALLGRMTLVETLEEAVAGHLASGGAWRVTSSGEGVDADGVVHLGAGAKDAELGMERQRKARDLEASRAQAAEAVDGLRSEMTAARTRVEASGITARRAVEFADGVERKGREEGRAQVAAAQAAATERTRKLRQDHQLWRTAARSELDADIARRRQVAAGAATSISREVEAELAASRAEAAARLAALRAEVEAQNEALRQERARRADELRTASLERARAGLSVLQDERDRHRGEVDRRSRALSTARERAADAGKTVAVARSGVDRIGSRVSEKRQVLVRLDAEVSAARDARVGLERRVQAIAEELSRSREELSVVRAAAAENEARVAGASMRAEDRSTVLDAARSRRLAADSAAFQSRRDATAADARLASLREDRAQTIATAEGARLQSIDAAERLDAARTRLGALARQGDEAQAEWLKVEAQITVLATKRQHAVEALESCVAREQSVRAARDQVQASLAEASHKRDRYRREQLELEDRERRLGQERETIQARMDERYQVDAGALLDHLLSASGITLAAPDEVRVDTEVAGRRFEAVEDMVVRPEMFQNADVIKAMVTRVEEARAELGRIGEVNLTAFEEYNELRTRHDDLESQRTDLDESVASIRSAIAKMNKTCRERFRETFDRVNEAFRTAYPELVGGGEAKLMLTDEEDLLETGVEIMVRPPGKRLQTLSLLSGGEKAMTAIALLLALFTVKPSPFCVLDEVDAPLDEANGARFNDMLKRMASMTQFLVVTHNRKTMECADTLYGITMPAPGCSTLVSVKIDG